MLKVIELDPSVTHDETKRAGTDDATGQSAIIKRADIARHQAIRDRRLQEKAHTEAQRQQSEAAVVEAQLSGYREGVRRGIYAALAPLNAMVTQFASVEAAIRQEATDVLKASLSEFASREPVLMALLEDILAAHHPGHGTQVTLRVPASVKHEALMARCIEAGLHAQIETMHDGNAFSVSWKGHMWTAHLAEFAQGAIAHADDSATPLMSATPPMSEAQLRAMCRDAIGGWIDALSDDVSGVAEEPIEGESWQ